MTLYLKAPTEADMIAALDAILPDFQTEDGPKFYTQQWSLDWDIPIVTTPAVLDGEGNVITPAVMEAGFFANLKTDLDTSAIAGMDQTPKAPQRVFAGDN